MNYAILVTGVYAIQYLHHAMPASLKQPSRASLLFIRMVTRLSDSLFSYLHRCRHKSPFKRLHKRT